MRYNVSPRYTSGSSALVDERTAVRVAEQEIEAYHSLIDNPQMIPADTLKARQMGLVGIVEEVLRPERKNRLDGFRVRDLITKEEYWRPKRGDQTPSCEEDNEHMPDQQTLTWKVQPAGEICAEVKCKFCGLAGTTRPVDLEWNSD